MSTVIAVARDETLRDSIRSSSRTIAPRSGRKIEVSLHAIDRWVERVDPDSTRSVASVAIAHILATGRVRPTPRHWLRRSATPGTTYAFSAAFPGVCVIVSNSTAVTIITRNLVRTDRSVSVSSRGPRHGADRSPMSRGRRLAPSWNGDSGRRPVRDAARSRVCWV